jgi:hypothetical protein
MPTRVIVHSLASRHPCSCPEFVMSEILYPLMGLCKSPSATVLQDPPGGPPSALTQTEGAGIWASFFEDRFGGTAPRTVGNRCCGRRGSV